MTTIVTKNGSGAPLASDLVQGELAVDLTNKRLYTENSGGSVIELGSNPTSLTTGTFTSTGIDDNATSTAITIDASENVGIGTTNTTYNTGGYNRYLNVRGTNGAVYAGADTAASNAVQLSWVSNNAVLYNLANGPLLLGTNNTERLRIDSSGNVGIGTDSPADNLEVSNTAGTAGVKITASTGGFSNLYFGDSVNDTVGSVRYDHAGNAMRFTTNSTERMRIDASGNVGIGTASPNGNLEVSSATQTKFFLIDTDGVLGTDSAVEIYNNNGKADIRADKQIEFTVGGTSAGGALSEAMRIASNGNVGIGTTSPTAPVHVSAIDGIAMRTGDSGAIYTFNAFVLENATYSLIEITIPGNRRGGTFEINLAGQSTSGVPRTQGARLVLSIGRADGDAEPYVIQNFSSADWTFAEPHVSGNVVTIGARVSNNGTATNQAAEITVFATGREGVDFTIAKSATSTTFPGTAPPTGGFNYIGDRNVGIGTDSPSKLLELESSDPTIRLSDTSDSTFSEISYNAGALDIDAGATSASKTTRFLRGGTESMRIDSSGNVDLYQGKNLTWRFAAGSTIRGSMSIDSADNITFSNGSSNTERMRLDTSGNLLVGQSTFSTTNAGTKITTGASDAHAFIANTTTTISAPCIYLNRQGGDGDIMHFRRSNTLEGWINVTASGTTYNSSSDVRLKENIVDAPSASADIDAIQIRSYDWKADGSHQKYGVVAQELVDIAPEAVAKGETEEDIWGVDYSKLVPMLVKEIQDLRARVAQLEEA